MTIGIRITDHCGSNMGVTDSFINNWEDSWEEDIYHQQPSDNQDALRLEFLTEMRTIFAEWRKSSDESYEKIKKALAEVTFVQQPQPNTKQNHPVTLESSDLQTSQHFSPSSSTKFGSDLQYSAPVTSTSPSPSPVTSPIFPSPSSPVTSTTNHCSDLQPVTANVQSSSPITANFNRSIGFTTSPTPFIKQQQQQSVQNLQEVTTTQLAPQIKYITEYGNSVKAEYEIEPKPPELTSVATGHYDIEPKPPDLTVDVMVLDATSKDWVGSAPIVTPVNFADSSGDGKLQQMNQGCEELNGKRRYTKQELEAIRVMKDEKNQQKNQWYELFNMYDFNPFMLSSGNLLMLLEESEVFNRLLRLDDSRNKVLWVNKLDDDHLHIVSMKDARQLFDLLLERGWKNNNYQMSVVLAKALKLFNTDFSLEYDDGCKLLGLLLHVLPILGQIPAILGVGEVIKVMVKYLEHKITKCIAFNHRGNLLAAECSDGSSIVCVFLKQKFKNMCNVIKDVLGDRVEKVVVSDRVIDYPCCLVTGEYVWTTNMERIMKVQALRDSSMNGYKASKKTMEINPENAIMDKRALESCEGAGCTKDRLQFSASFKGNNMDYFNKEKIIRVTFLLAVVVRCVVITSAFGEMVIRVGWAPKNSATYDAFLSTLVRVFQPDETIKFLSVIQKQNCFLGLKFFSDALYEVQISPTLQMVRNERHNVIFRTFAYWLDLAKGSTMYGVSSADGQFREGTKHGQFREGTKRVDSRPVLQRICSERILNMLIAVRGVGYWGLSSLQILLAIVLFTVGMLRHTKQRLQTQATEQQITYTNEVKAYSIQAREKLQVVEEIDEVLLVRTCEDMWSKIVEVNRGSSRFIFMIAWISSLAGMSLMFNGLVFASDATYQQQLVVILVVLKSRSLTPALNVIVATRDGSAKGFHLFSISTLQILRTRFFLRGVECHSSRLTTYEPNGIVLFSWMCSNSRVPNTCLEHPF